MARLFTIDTLELHSNDKFCQELEDGNILFFPTCPFEFPKEELEFLLAQKQTGAANRKNIAYKPELGKITNFERSSVEEQNLLLEVMRNFSTRSVQFLSKLLPAYAGRWRLDYASFRPFQEKGRQLRIRARNDLLHVDAFPTRPMHGNRILRFFININPNESRYWTTTEPFARLASRFGGTGGVSFPSGVNESLLAGVVRQSKKMARLLGLPVTLRSPYDIFMLNLHNFLKENAEFQKSCPKEDWEFPPYSCWAVFTDQVSHAATAGQYALEQTLIVPHSALIDPEKAPLHILEKLSGRRMADSILSR